MFEVNVLSFFERVLSHYPEGGQKEALLSGSLSSLPCWVDASETDKEKGFVVGILYTREPALVHGMHMDFEELRIVVGCSTHPIISKNAMLGFSYNLFSRSVIVIYCRQDNREQIERLKTKFVPCLRILH